MNTNNWAYAALTMNNPDNGVGTIYFTKSYFEQEGIVDPTTAEPYTKEALDKILAGRGENAYIEAPVGALMAMSLCNDGKLYWFDAGGCASVVSHADPLTLAEDGTLKDQNGTTVATPIA